MRQLVHALHESSRLAQKHVGLSGAQLFVLQKLADTPGVSINDLASRTHTHQSSVSTVVARLARTGLVRRTRSAADRRSVTLSLTAKGTRRLAAAPDVAQHRLIHAITRFSAGRRRLLASALTDLVAAMDIAERVPAMFLEQPLRASRKKTRASRTD